MIGAFIINHLKYISFNNQGWDLILEYIIGTASSANALSQYIDKITGGKIKEFLLTNFPINSPFLGPYPDLVAFGLVILVTGLMILGVKESAMMNKVFTLLNITVLSFITIIGMTKIDLSNWTKNPQVLFFNLI